MLFVFCPTLSSNIVHIITQNSSYCYPFNAKTFRHAYYMYRLSLSVFVTICFLSRKKALPLPPIKQQSVCKCKQKIIFQAV